jgi:hypothetical protein
MTPVSPPSLFEAFNARALEPQEVARTFVASEHFYELLKHSHTLVFGPRGSGKTTLLKMLQQQALDVWPHPNAVAVRNKVNYTGIFIATDVTWREQVNAMGRPSLPEQYARLFSIAAFTTHVLRATVHAMEYRTKNNTSTMTFEQEAGFVKDLCPLWHIEPKLPTLQSLRYALSGRLSNIRETVNKELLLPEAGRGERLAKIPYLHLHFLQSAAVALELYDDAIAKQKSKWAFLFDELELAPKWILSTLIDSLRSVDDRFLFKLSMSPYSSETTQLGKTLAAMPGHDFNIVTLWYAHKEDGFQFCRSIVQQVLASNKLEDVTPDDLLGKSPLETSREEWESGTAYKKGSRLYDRFLSAARTDRSFHEYLQKHRVDLNELQNLSGNDRAAIIRKITTVLAIREAFRKDTTNKITLRGRKNPKLYHGAKSIYALSEGNPRWLIGLISRLVIKCPPEAIRKGHESGQSPIVSAAIQNKEINDAAHRFRALLRTIPLNDTDINSRGMLSVLDTIGAYFFKCVVSDAFNPEPPLTFTIDSNTENALTDSLEKALNAGAIVYIPDDPSERYLNSFKAKRFRLSYLLSPIYHTPLILGKSLSLSRILREGSGLESKGLFDE